jgi:hypothetical protein
MKGYEYSSFLNVSLCCWPRRFDVFGILFSSSLNRRTDRLGESNIRIAFFVTNTQELHYAHALLLNSFPRYFYLAPISFTVKYLCIKYSELNLRVCTLLIIVDQSKIKLNSLLMKKLPIHISIYPKNVETFHRDTYKRKISSNFLPFNLVKHTVSNRYALKG